MEFPDQASFQEYAQSTGRTYVSINLQQPELHNNLGTILLELYTDICPRTCESFLNFVNGHQSYHYKGSPIHRVVQHAFIQGGDVVDGTGKGSIPGYVLPDETFAVKHDEEGILGMANNGEPHTGSTQFYITLNPLKWLDGKRVAFGKVITQEGLDVLKKVESVSCNNERPVPEVIIAECNIVLQGSA
mmetsp:Transcript_40188/g.89173  ORF Transcript_40188/g.89173 Transcript_40188/m.89173 type:complete len:188 (+) Transcript_40188:182-745(+)|eukprot:CAMPEP_0202902132 /NCGR_PEP_ID=MMETSP1392-20130828/16523_1 /ASSEMBLY_ACC=CAM_ASM_000868 /TAXON_ID=225041 /ORGANISM="Chlamydomonas chlamydogama, Strain SAG 11-48b" /LENGTH=187 /DNA_ID=CAMNT_0049588847 /DNA_START=174 /DNA_END=737 /DNA_ORIENTATION=-